MLRVNIQKRLATIALDMQFELAGDVLVLFGASGSGKSMTLKLIAGIDQPDRGVIQVNDRLLFDTESRVDMPPQARRIGYVPQNYALFPHLSALDNITLPLRRGLRWSAAKADARALALLELVGLPGRGGSHPRELSGGQQQRVALARALAIEPEVLLLDEPFAALDAPIRAELRAQFGEIQRAMRVPTIFVTHDMEEAVALARQLAVVVEGRIRQLGPARAILDRPADLQVAELVQSRNILPGRLSRTADRAVVVTALGELPVGPSVFGDGEPVALIMRPEALRIARDDPPFEPRGDDLHFSGTITDFVDLGTRAVVTFNVSGALLEASLSPAAARRIALAPHGSIHVTVARGDLHLISLATAELTSG